MDFPEYVPAAVSKHVAMHLTTLQTDLNYANRELEDLEREITSTPHDSEHINRLRVDFLTKMRLRDHAVTSIECLRGLVDRFEMRDVYTALTAELVEDEQWRRFINAAWEARRDYSEYRELIKRTAELRDDIAETASNLARQLRQICHIGIKCPDAFYSLTKLLESTDNEEGPADGVAMWHVVRHKIVANPDLSYAWEKSPPLWALLSRLAEVARNFTPADTAEINDAISSRQRNVKTEYIRGFHARLAGAHIAITSTMKRAMATVATVVLNDPIDDVSDGDVRQVISRIGKKQ